YIVVAVVTVAFFIANWALLSAPVPINLLFARAETPLAVLLLLCAGVVLLLDLVIHTLGGHAWRHERRALRAQLDDVRSRAENEEESRIQVMRVPFEREFAVVRAQLDRVLAEVRRLDHDTVEIPPLAAAPAIEPELIPPRPDPVRRKH